MMSATFSRNDLEPTYPEKRHKNMHIKTSFNLFACLVYFHALVVVC